MADSKTTNDDDRDIAGAIKKWAIIGVVLLIVGLLLAAFLPRWWAQLIGGIVQGRLTYGSFFGFVLGFIASLVPLVLLRFAFRHRDNGGMAIFALILALITAMPNLMTLWIVQGGSNAAHAGQRIFDVDAPGFRWASALGAVAGVGLYLFFWWLARQRLASERAEAKAKAELEAAGGDSK